MNITQVKKLFNTLIHTLFLPVSDFATVLITPSYRLKYDMTRLQFKESTLRPWPKA